MKRPFRTLLCLGGHSRGLTVLSAPADAGLELRGVGDSYSSASAQAAPTPVAA